MKVKVTEKEVKITELTQVNQGEYGINKCEFILPESFEGLSVTAVFNGIPVLLTDGKCYIPSLKNGNCILGVYAYRQNDGETVIMYSPKPTMFFVDKGSFCDSFNELVIPEVFDYETYCRMLQDYWRDIINFNTLPEYTEGATENQYYSAKVLNEMYHTLQGDLDEIGDLVGKEIVTESIIAEGTYSFKEMDYVAGACVFNLSDINCSLEENDRCNLIFNGEAYENLVPNITEESVYFGNLGILGGDDTGEDYLVAFTESEGIKMFTNLPAGEYTVSLEKIVGGGD